MPAEARQQVVLENRLGELARVVNHLLAAGFLLNELGNALDACGRYDEAFHAYRRFNEIDKPHYDRLAVSGYHSEIIGAWTPEAIGDYVGGPNHVLPTARSARFSSGLSVLDFMKRTTLAKMTPAALKAIGPAAETLARSESLEAHGLSVRARLDRLNEGPP